MQAVGDVHVHDIDNQFRTAIPWLAFGNGTGSAATEFINLGQTVLDIGFTHIDTAQVGAASLYLWTFSCDKSMADD